MEKEKGLKLFGVRIEAATATVMEEEEEDEVMRKSQSMGNLCAANQSSAADHGYLSDGGLAQNSRSRSRQERKRGIPWTEEEHRTFLAGLEKLGKGDWRGISRNFVTTRTPTQVASHAQKYFLRQSNPNKKKRRSSLFDVGINDNATPPPTETHIQLSPKKVDTAADRTANHLMNAQQSLVAAPMITRVSEASQPLTLATNNIATPTHQSVNLLGVSSRDEVNSRFYGNPAALSVAPDFLQLSLPNYVPVHESVKPPSFDSSDLELSIAPPQPHPLAKLPPQHASGTIRHKCQQETKTDERVSQLAEVGVWGPSISLKLAFGLSV